ncbi:hypothetical protein CULT_1810013 [[Clostridium] ultunense Esp]|nr:hypothetical protein CULT_1810013 [[Clostridium] ultunense Esp]
MAHPARKRMRDSFTSLFNEAEETADPAAEDPTIETITYDRRKKVDSGKSSLKTCQWKRPIPLTRG